MSLVGDLLARFRGTGRTGGLPLLPLDPAEGPVYAVGDLHGCRRLLRGLEDMIREDAAQFAGRPRIILLGDMIDRGPETAGLIDDLLHPLPWASRMAIRGNHEEMMLAFLDNPAKNSAWLDQGGYETLRSYGLALDPTTPLALPRRRLQQMLAAHLPDTHLAWLRALPAGYALALNGQTWVLAHAGCDPHRSLSDQPAGGLFWGGVFPGPEDKICLVHGHVVQSEVNIAGPCIGIDTGAYKTGKLTALRLAEGIPPFVITHTIQSGRAPQPSIF